ncbi:pirin family protein [Methanobacterium formicicum]|uniref:Pirin n=1 Tax=Methanobacterium formicicum (strain DSM 3637 / PP1) TaxID=1204725 RepID=K2RET7_METFP|nr:pirin family protein [Methanobacterium formicicum]EKF86889.1 pirin [Methanobacterium formicicum DSM 3637]
MSIRNVTEIVEPVYVMEGAGVRLRRTIATDYLDYLDPFLLFDHFGSRDPQDYLAGFPLHPHRGIETVTYMLSGNVNHKDSMGNSGTIGACDVQWMTSGSGILHEEMPQEPEEGKLEGFQLWVNLPAKLKMTHPRYQEVKASQIPEITLFEGVQVKIIAGELNGVKGPVTEIFADPEYLDVSLEARSSFEHNLPQWHTVFAYVFEGEGVFDEEGTLVSATNLVIFGDGESIKVHTENKPLRFLLISGKPLNEPIARYGPFVMNTPEEIEDALRDLQKGTFVK